MKYMGASEQAVAITGEAQQWRLDGVLTAHNCDQLAALSELVSGDVPLSLELEGLDIDDARAALAMIDALRALARRHPLALHHAPQLLAHTLYRIGELEGAASIVLVEPRLEEPYG